MFEIEAGEIEPGQIKPIVQAVMVGRLEVRIMPGGKTGGEKQIQFDVRVRPSPVNPGSRVAHDSQDAVRRHPIADRHSDFAEVGVERKEGTVAPVMPDHHVTAIVAPA